MRTLVSILIPCFNAERWIGQAIESALLQTHASTEIIVVDDGSSDGSLDVIKRFGKRIRWESGPNRGANAARNQLLALARGLWLQYLDADDYLLPDKIERQIAFLDAHPGADIIYSPISLVFNYYGARGLAGWERGYIVPIPEPRDPWILLVREHLPQTGGPLCRKSAIKAVGGWKSDQVCCQEYELYLRLLMAGHQFVYCPHVGAVHRRWSEATLSRRNESQTARQFMKILDRAEKFLITHGELKQDRRRAIDQQRSHIRASQRRSQAAPSRRHKRR
jgi:glycosyltransferase involved in cell wall biosynthesis